MESLYAPGNPDDRNPLTGNGLRTGTRGFSARPCEGSCVQTQAGAKHRPRRRALPSRVPLSLARVTKWTQTAASASADSTQRRTCGGPNAWRAAVVTDNLVTVTFPSAFRSETSRTPRRHGDTFTAAAVSAIGHFWRRAIAVDVIAHDPGQLLHDAGASAASEMQNQVDCVTLWLQ